MKTLQGLPEEFDSEELFRRLIFIDKLEKASKQADSLPKLPDHLPNQI
jgi:hypothetical protein